MKTYSPFVISSAAFVIAAALFVTGSLAYASKGSSHSSTNAQSSSISDDGTPDQGRGDFNPNGTPVVTPGSDDGTADQGRGDASVGGAPAVAGQAGQLEVEADVFTDITIVKVEINDAKSFYETKTTDRNALIQEIAAKFSLDAARVAQALSFEIENRASRPKDRN